MIENELHLRIIENKDWVTILFVISFALIAATKSAFENRFGDFMSLIYSDRYNRIYKDSSNLKSGFTISLFFIQITALAFFIQLTLTAFGVATKTDWILYIQITTFLLYFILSKYLIEKIIATAFNIEEFVTRFNIKKVVIRSYIVLFLLPINIVLFYTNTISTSFLSILIGVLLVTNTLTYILSIKSYQNVIFGKLFYFILYLCALEIAPYYFIYYWFTKSVD